MDPKISRAMLVSAINLINLTAIFNNELKLKPEAKTTLTLKPLWFFEKCIF